MALEKLKLWFSENLSKLAETEKEIFNEAIASFQEHKDKVGLINAAFDAGKLIASKEAEIVALRVSRTEADANIIKAFFPEAIASKITKVEDEVNSDLSKVGIEVK